MQDRNPGVLVSIDDGHGTLTGQNIDDIVQHFIRAGYRVGVLDGNRPARPAGRLANRCCLDEPSSTTTNLYYPVIFLGLDNQLLHQEVDELLAQNDLVILINTSLSVLAKSAGSLHSQMEREAFWSWLAKSMSKTFAMPTRAKAIILGGTDKELSLQTAHLEEVARLFTPEAKTIDCYRSGVPLDKPERDRLVIDVIASVLPAPTLLRNRSDGELVLSNDYKLAIANLEQLRSNLKTALEASQVTDEKLREILELVTPIGLETALTMQLPITIKPDSIPQGYSQDHRLCRLLSAQPRNEHDLLTYLAFPLTDLSSIELIGSIESLPLKIKDDLLIDLMTRRKHEDKAESGLPVAYTFELLTSYNLLRRIRDYLPEVEIATQQLSPRYEYDLPPIIEEFDLTDSYLECFDQSMISHSRLEATSAIGVCLGGHKLRWRITLNLDQIRTLSQLDVASAELTALTTMIIEATGVKHPVLTSWLSEAEARS